MHKGRSIQNDCIWHGKLVAPKVWCRELQSEFCDGLWITSRKPLEAGLDFISRCSKADYLYNRHNRKYRTKELSPFWQRTKWYIKWASRNASDLLRCSVLWLPVINQNPHSRGGPKKDSRKSRDIQSPSHRQCELKCADSRAVTKQGLFDCEPAHTADWMVQCDKTTCAQWTMNVKCNMQICFHLWQSVNENKCITAARVPTKVIDENLWNPRRLRVPS